MVYLAALLAFMGFLVTFYDRSTGFKRYVIFCLCLGLPVVSVFMSLSHIGGVTLTPLRIFLIPGMMLLFPLFSSASKRVRFSRLTVSVIIFSLYLVTIEFANGHVYPSQIFDFILIILYSLLIDNTRFNQEDVKYMTIALTVLVLVSFAASIIQAMVDPAFLFNDRIYDEAANVGLIKAFGDIYRNPSVYTGLMGGDGDFIMGVLFAWFLFEFAKSKKKYFLLFAALIGACSILTFNRSAWIFLVVGLILFSVFNVKRVYMFIIILVVTVLYAFNGALISSLFETNFVQERVLASSYEERITTHEIFFKYLWHENILLGSGIYDPSDGFRAHGRWGGSLDGFITIYRVGGLLGLFLFLNIFYKWISLAIGQIKRNKNIVVLSFLISYISYNFTLSNPEFQSFLVFFILLAITKMNEDVRVEYTLPVKAMKKSKQVTPNNS